MVTSNGVIVSEKRRETENDKAEMSMIRQFNTNCFGQCIEVLSLLKCVNMDHT